MTTTVVAAKSEAELEQVRALSRDFLAWHRRQDAQHVALINRYFDDDAFAAELASLAERYGPPGGALLLAQVDGQPAGCVAMHDLGGGTAEMKRMFVGDAFRGHGVGRALGDGIISAARTAGYARLRLETSRNQTDAIRLYERLGFRPIAPYYAIADDDIRGWLVFFEKEL